MSKDITVEGKKYDRLLAVYFAADNYLKAETVAEKKKHHLALESAVFMAAEFFDLHDEETK